MSASFTTLPPRRFVGLPRLASRDIGAAPARPDAEDRARREAVRQIVDEIERGGARSLRRYAEAFDGLPTDAPLFVERDELGGRVPGGLGDALVEIDIARALQDEAVHATS